MAYLRKENKKGKTYISICESYRDESGAVQRRTLHNLGNVASLGEDSLRNIATKLLELTKTPIIEDDTKELNRLNYGYVMVMHEVLKKYNLHDFFRRLSKKHHLSFSLIQPMLLMLCDRLNDPISKLGSHTLQHEYYGIEPIELQHLYRTLDYLSLHNEAIQSHIYAQNRNLFDYELDVVFFDVTTFYFDSHVIEEGALRQLGFGKDGKVGKTQIVFSLLIDKNKMPIGFEIFNGKQFEGHTFENAVRSLKEKYAIRKVIVVADSGMMSKNNISFFQKGNIAQTYEYIVGDRLKVLPDKIKAQLVDKKNYKSMVTTDKDAEQSLIKVCVIEHDGKKIIGTWSEKRAKKDKHERENKIEKAKKLLTTPDQLKKKAKNYYIKTSNKIAYELDTERIKEDAKYDGFKAIATNAQSISIELALEHYSFLYQIEHSFRTFKSYLETRPMYHWTDQRIKGHLVLCYISFVMLRYIQQKTNLTENEVRKILSKMEISQVLSNTKTFWVRSAQDQKTVNLIKQLNLKSIPHTISTEAMANYISTIL